MLKIHVVVRIAVCFLFVFLPLQSMDEWFYDRFFKLRGYHKDPTPFVLIRVNNANLSESLAKEYFHYPKDEPPPGSKGSYIWHHRFYESLIRNIEADSPRLIVFTSFYDSIDDNSVTKIPYPNVILSAYLDEESKLIIPGPPLANGDAYGFSNIFPDSDNVVRRTNLVYSSGSSLALRTYHRLVDEPVKRNLMDPLFIDYRGPSGSYPSLGGREISEGDFPRGTFKDKIVLIGRDSSRFSEYETPLGRMTKLEVQANIIDTFLSGREIQILPRIFNLCLSAFAVASSVLIILYFPLTMAWLLLLLQSILFLLVSVFVFSYFKMWTGIANPIFCIFATHLLMLGYKLSKQEEEQWKIQQETENLKEMDQFKNNFISLFSHDLKTPIAKIRAMTERTLSEHPEIPNDVREALKGIDRTNTELARLISDILKVTKMEAMRLEPSREVIDLNRLVEEAVQRLKFLADEKNIPIVMDLEPLFSMEGDQHLIGEVITNLIENAIKYSPENRRIVVRTTEEEGKVRVSVIDEGEGIPPDEIPRVTGKFYRGKGVTVKQKGSGLGLYLSKYFVELHQGQLDIQSEVGKGTAVSFWLPLTA